MAHYAQISGSFEATRSIVTRVIVAEQDFINSGGVGDSFNWIQCSYNTISGRHPLGTGFRKNFPAKSWYYDKTIDVFIEPKPDYPSWILNEDTCQWEPPVSASSDEIANYCFRDSQHGYYVWDEDTTSWVDSRET